jgi:hypothetical protein
MATSAPVAVSVECSFEHLASPKRLPLDEFLFLLPRVLESINKKRDREDFVSALQRTELVRNDPVMQLFE